MIHTVESEFVAVLILLDTAPPAAALGLESIDGGGQVARPKPLYVQLRVRKSLKNKLAGCVKLARDAEVLLAGFCGDTHFVHFFPFPFCFSASNISSSRAK